MEMAGGVLIGLSFAASGGVLVWKMHAIGALLAIGLVLVALGACAVAGALLGAGIGMIMSSAAGVAVLVGLLWIVFHTGGG